MDFDEFIKQLKVKNLPLDKKYELMDFFDRHQKEMIELKNHIDTTDREIDDMVFDLYELTDEERKVVLS